MNVIDSDYGNTGEEFQEICRFLNGLSNQDPNMLWESVRMNFWQYNVHANRSAQDPFFKENLHIWRSNERQIVALCISEYGRNDLFIEVLPAYHEIHPDIFRWIVDSWAGTREVIDIEIYAADRTKISWLEENGFSFNCHFENERSYDLDQIDLQVRLEDGFAVQTFSESHDYAGRVALTRSAFNNPRYTETNLKGLIASPDYIDEYNLIVVSPDQRPVAYCVGWHDSATENHGYIEPVGTHAEFRRRGFATAVIRECFQRMKANGIKVVKIASRAEPDVSNYLYESLSPRDKREVHRYSKKVSGA